MPHGTSPACEIVDLTGRTLLAKYEIEGLLGRGGMGAVWRARHALTGRKLAVKILDETYLDNHAVVQRFGREARAASACQHQGIVEVLDLDQTEDGIPFLVMEFLEGETLARRIERRGRLEQDEIVHLGGLLLEALEAAHEHGVIHRDLKPENIHVVPAGRRGDIVKILDFGISHKRDEAAAKLTMTGSVLGTPHYMSPEAAMGDTDVDRRADVYAAGVVLYECAVGDVPFDAPNYNKLLRTILDQQPVPPRRRGAQISESVERLILWAMEKEREKRVPSATEMLTWLKRAAAGEEVPYKVPREEPPPKARVERSSPASVRPAGGLPLAPAGSLPVGRPGLSPSLGESPVSDTEPPARSSWESAPAPSSSQRPPPSAETAAKRQGARDLDFDAPDESSAPRMLELELDEDALRGRSLPAPAAGALGGSAVRTGPHPAVATGVVEASGRFPAVQEPPRSSPAPAATWPRYVLLGLLALAVFVGLVFAVRWIVQPSVDPAELDPDIGLPDPGPTHQPDPGARPAARTWVSVEVRGLPPGARLRVDGLPATSPLRLARGRAHVLDVSAPGYEDRRIEITADQNRSVDANLRPAEGTVQRRP